MIAAGRNGLDAREHIACGRRQVTGKTQVHIALSIERLMRAIVSGVVPEFAVCVVSPTAHATRFHERAGMLVVGGNGLDTREHVGGWWR
jgi:hypothetical protein